MSLTSRAYGERGRRRAVKQGIDPERLAPGQSPTAPGKWPVLTVGAAPVDPFACRSLRRRTRGVSQP